MCRGQDICWRRDNQKIAAPPTPPATPSHFVPFSPSFSSHAVCYTLLSVSLAVNKPWSMCALCSVTHRLSIRPHITHTHTLVKAKNAHTAMCMWRLSITPRTWREGQQSNKDCRALSKVLNSLNNGSAASVLTSHYYHYRGEAEREAGRKRERGETREETCCRWLRDVKALGR